MPTRYGSTALCLRLASVTLAIALLGCGARTELESYLPGSMATDASTPPALDTGAPCVTAELASGLGTPTAIAVDESFVYWLELGAPGTNGADGGSLSRCGKGGCAGAPTVLASSLLASASQNLVLDDTRLYWTEGTRGLRACDKQACVPTALMHTPSEPDTMPVYVALDTQTVYFSSIRSVGSCSKEGCASATTLAELVTAGAAALATDADEVYFLDGVAVRACSKPACTGEPRTIAAMLAQVPLGIAVDDANVYFSIGGAASAPDDSGAVLVCPKSGCPGAPSVLAAGLSHPTYLALDASRVYWIDDGTSAADYADGDVEACPKSGCAERPSVIASHQPLPNAIAVDESCVYWANDGAPDAPGNGSVRRAAK